MVGSSNNIKFYNLQLTLYDFQRKKKRKKESWVTWNLLVTWKSFQTSKNIKVIKVDSNMSINKRSLVKGASWPALLADFMLFII